MAHFYGIRLGMLVILVLCFTWTNASALPADDQLDMQLENYAKNPKILAGNKLRAEAKAKERQPGCSWNGTAPFCRGYCNSQVYKTVTSDRCGDGKCCFTGTKKYCCPK
ncbi:uncharacterized protein LOC130694132 [Daphnia carinata]|uniref:uncharacterized protein LOC130694132 n=1 Tax=Daphnia carinata TaxID=120202 RepID=UPI00257F0B01|nr:uncharacterized protein LOC130694132 [Daphnia carinata]